MALLLVYRLKLFLKQFHKDPNQNLDGAKKLIETLPKEFKHYNDPFMKVLNALE